MGVSQRSGRDRRISSIIGHIVWHSFELVLLTKLSSCAAILNIIFLLLNAGELILLLD